LDTTPAGGVAKATVGTTTLQAQIVNTVVPHRMARPSLGLAYPEARYFVQSKE
jgi:hypothetical protein